MPASGRRGERSDVHNYKFQPFYAEIRHIRPPYFLADRIKIINLAQNTIYYVPGRIGDSMATPQETQHNQTL